VEGRRKRGERRNAKEDEIGLVIKGFTPFTVSFCVCLQVVEDEIEKGDLHSPLNCNLRREKERRL
jgi:hypothetical protein